MVKKYTSMAYANADELIFGQSKFPVKAGLGLEIGAGYTTPEVNYAPRPGAGASKEKLIKEYERITTDIMARMVQIGAPSVVLETEHVQQMSNNPEWGGAVAHAQKTIMEEYHDEYGISVHFATQLVTFVKTVTTSSSGETSTAPLWRLLKKLPTMVQTCLQLSQWVVRKSSTILF